MRKWVFFIVAWACVCARAMPLLPAPGTGSQGLATHAMLPKPNSVPSTDYQLTVNEMPKPLAPGWDNRVVGRYLPSALSATGLPQPSALPRIMKKLTLMDAILLALRNNTDVLAAQMKRIDAKYALEIANNQFNPHFDNLSLTESAGTDGRLSFGGVNPSLSMNTRWGTTIKANYYNDFSGGNHNRGGGAITVSQPLLQGLGLPRLRYLDDMATYHSSLLDYRSAILSTVNAVISAYLQLVQDKMNFINQQKNLKQQQQQFEYAKIKLRAGTIAPSEYRAQKANYMSNLLTFTQQRLALKNQYQTFIAQLGLDPKAKLVVPGSLSFYHLAMVVPSQSQALDVALHNNLDYQRALFNMAGTQRAIERARDALKWSLTVNVTHSFGGTGDASSPPGSQSNALAATPAIPTHLIPGAGASAAGSNSGSITLGIPLDSNTRLSNRSALVQARVSYELAKLKLRKTKQELVQKIITDYQSIGNDKQSLVIAKTSVQLKKEVLKDVQIKYSYGKTTAFELATTRQDFLAQQQALVSAKIKYFTDVNQLHQDMGDDLAVWHIKLRY